MAEMVDKLRNIAIVGHGGAGKTSLAEVMLFDAGVTNRIGRVEDGNTAMDFEPEELKRSASISTGLHQFSWKKHTVTLLDTPGDQNFFTDTKLCMEAADGAVFVVDAVDGVRVQTEQGWAFAEEFNMPSAIFINRLDRDRSDFQRTLQDIAANLDTPKPILLQLPIGSVAEFKGLVDLISMKACIFDAEGKMTTADIPADMQDAAETAHEELIENVAEADDELIERYLEGETLSDDDIKTALRAGTLSRTFVPVLCGSAMNVRFLMSCTKQHDWQRANLAPGWERGDWCFGFPCTLRADSWEACQLPSFPRNGPPLVTSRKTRSPPRIGHEPPARWIPPCNPRRQSRRFTERQRRSQMPRTIRATTSSTKFSSFSAI